MSQKQSSLACTPHFGRIHSEMGKENKLAFRNYMIYLIFTRKPPPQKRMKWDENETLHWIMRWGWMGWKRNLAFNNDDGKKLYINYLHKKINKKFNYYPPSHPAFSCSSSLSENRNKITQKMYYQWTHYMVQYTVQNWQTLHGSVCGSELTR